MWNKILQVHKASGNHDFVDQDDSQELQRTLLGNVPVNVKHGDLESIQEDCMCHDWKYMNAVDKTLTEMGDFTLTIYISRRISNPRIDNHHVPDHQRSSLETSL